MNEELLARINRDSAKTKDVLARLRAERAAIRRVSRMQMLWWWLVFLMGTAAGYALAEWVIDPVTIVLPKPGISV